MAAHEKFNCKSKEDLQSKIAQLGLDIGLSEDISILAKPVVVGGRAAPNGFAVLPMEGCDSNPDGSPSMLVERRYERFSRGGAGLLWWEACAVVAEGKANPLQMMLTEDNAAQFEKLVKKSNRNAADANGQAHKPLHIVQLTHSGRYSRPDAGGAQPLLVQRDPILDPLVGGGQWTLLC